MRLALRFFQRVLLLAFITSVLAAGCAVLSSRESVPRRHPEEVKTGPVDCRECHEDGLTGTLKPYEVFRHSSIFIARHGSYAALGQNLCVSCHAESFCQSCHARKDGINPALRNGDRPDLFAPHRGDYLVQHPLDGRMDPGSCLRCHGNRNNQSCTRCHK